MRNLVGEIFHSKFLPKTPLRCSQMRFLPLFHTRKVLNSIWSYGRRKFHHVFRGKNPSQILLNEDFAPSLHLQSPKLFCTLKNILSSSLMGMLGLNRIKAVVQNLVGENLMPALSLKSLLRCTQMEILHPFHTHKVRNYEYTNGGINLILFLEGNI